VTSISADTHKYGYAPKGTGVLLYRSPDLRRHQYFILTDWQGGVYASPGLAGSRSGGLIAATWAAMVSLGESGYLELAERILATASELRGEVERIPELQTYGDSPFMVAFGSEALDIWHVNDALAERGWRLNGCQLPAGLHFCVTRPNTQPGVVEAFAADLRAAVAYAKDPPPEPPRSGALYGAGGPGAPAAADLLLGYLDATSAPAPEE
jgi:glutamate/tyrosine decarboxylase-like PLP-dependent enzyme